MKESVREKMGLVKEGLVFGAMMLSGGVSNCGIKSAVEVPFSSQTLRTGANACVVPAGRV